MAMVFLAGPLSGLIMQPFIGQWFSAMLKKKKREIRNIYVILRCSKRQLKVPFRQTATLHGWWYSTQRGRNTPPGIHTSIRQRVYYARDTLCKPSSSFGRVPVFSLYLRIE
jgi:hypothetical protein